jgi:TRAP-type C4-dicarboxylate transport system permease large subunit
MMVAAGHDKARSAGLIASAGIIAPILPPSIGFVVFGVAANVVDLQALPRRHRAGLMLGASLWLTWWWLARREHRLAATATVQGGASPPSALRLGARPAGDHHRRPEVRRVHAHRGRRRRRGLRPVRSTVVYRELKWNQLYGVFVRAARTTSVVMLLVAAAAVSAWLITVANIPGQVVALLQPLHDTRSC